VPTETKDSSLIRAVRARATEEVGSLLPEGADPNARDPDSTLTALMFAAGMGSDAVVALLVAAGALVNAIDGRAGASALHKACQGGHLQTVKELTKAGALINLQTTSTGHTPLIEAIWFASDEVVDYLLGQGARVELVTHYGFSMDDHIKFALNVNQAPTAHTALLRIRSLVDERRKNDERGQSQAALINAVLAGDLQAVRAALDAGAPVDQRYPIVGSFNDGHTALLIAAREGLSEIVALLIEAVADVNAVEPVFGAVPLHKATYNGHEDIVRLLAAAVNIDLDFQGPSNGYTPLHDSLWHGFRGPADVLIDAGARLDLVAYDGKLARDLAIQSFGAQDPIVARLTP
jgi:uncharacterized protein